MKHRRSEIEEEQAKSPAGRSERSKENKNADGDGAKHPEKTREDVSLIDVSQPGNDTEHHCDSVARFAFCSLCCAAHPIAAVTAFGIFRQKMPAIRARHLVTCARFRPGSRRIRVFHLHISKITSRTEFVKQTEILPKKTMKPRARRFPQWHDLLRAVTLQCGAAAPLLQQTSGEECVARGGYSLFTTTRRAGFRNSKWALTFWICAACSFRLAVKASISFRWCATVASSLVMLAWKLLRCSAIITSSSRNLRPCSSTLPCSLRNSLSNIAFTAS